MTLRTDPDFRLTGPERFLLALLKVPEAPAPPDGSPESLRVFRAGRNYYVWSLIMWALVVLAALVTVVSASVALLVAIRSAEGLPRVVAAALLAVMWFLFLSIAGIGLLSRRLNYGLRWYIVTDRSLRIRSGIFQMNELTMTYSNVQEIRVTSGPLQLLLGIADVEVQAAGGGGNAEHGGGHIGRFSGVANAEEIRDLIVEQLRQYRDSGLGETAPVASVALSGSAAVAPMSDLAAARMVLTEARALHEALAAPRA